MPSDFYPGHRFTKFIMTEPVLQTYRPPAHLKLYDGTTDPQSHVDAFKNAMLVSGDFDAMRCKAFPSMLSEAAQQWFSSLPRRSVGSFTNLTDKFLNHFTASRAHEKTIRSLDGLNQGESESLKDFIGRFN